MRRRPIRGARRPSPPTACAPDTRRGRAARSSSTPAWRRRGGLHVGDRVRLAANGPARAHDRRRRRGDAAAVKRSAVMFVTDARRRDWPATRPRRHDRRPRGARRRPRPARARVHIAPAAAGRVVTGSARAGPRTSATPKPARRSSRSPEPSAGSRCHRDVRRREHARAGGAAARARGRAPARSRRDPSQVRRMIGWETLARWPWSPPLAGVVPGVAPRRRARAGVRRSGHRPRGHVSGRRRDPRRGAGPRRRPDRVGRRCGRRPARRTRRARPRPSRTSAVEPSLIGPVRGILRSARRRRRDRAAIGRWRRSSWDTSAATAACIASSSSSAPRASVRSSPVSRRGCRARSCSAVAHVSGFLAVANMRSAARRFSSARRRWCSPWRSGTLLFVGTTREHATANQERDRVTADLAVRSDGPGSHVGVADGTRTRRRHGRAARPRRSGPSLGSVYSSTPRLRSSIPRASAGCSTSTSATARSRSSAPEIALAVGAGRQGATPRPGSGSRSCSATGRGSTGRSSRCTSTASASARP